jgi:hypothetical protein
MADDELMQDNVLALTGASSVTKAPFEERFINDVNDGGRRRRRR